MMVEESEIVEFYLDLHDMSKDGGGDAAALVEPSTRRRRRRGHLPKKDLLKMLMADAVDAGLKAAAEIM